MEYDYKNDCWVSLAVLPSRVKALCTAVGYDTLVLVNECLTDSERESAYKHELKHIKRGDLYSDLKVEDVEREVV